MPPIRSASKLSSQPLDLPLLDLLSDPLKYDDVLLRRFTAELDSNNRDAPLKTQSKKKTPDPRKLAMSAANLSSQCLGNIIRAGWKASDPSTMNEVSMNNVLSISQVFRTAIRSLRGALPKSLDIERVASSCIGKVVALELFPTALDLLWETKPCITALYCDSSNIPTVSKRAVAKQPRAPPLAQYYTLLQYPMPPPTDPVIVLLICTSIVQSLMAITALLPTSSANPVDTFISYLDGSVLLDWIAVCPNEQQDSLLSRSHKAVAFTLADTNIVSDFSLKLRIWSLRCLLHKPTLDPEMFWLQAVRYLITHGKPLHSARLYDKAALETIMLFDNIIPSAISREDSKSFMSGSAYNKFCETILVFAQKGSNLSEAQRVGNFVKIDVNSESAETTRAHHIAVFGHALNALEHVPGTDDRGSIEGLTTCCTMLSNDSTVFMDADGSPKLIPCLEKLRRLCVRHVEERKGGEQLHKTIITFCDSFIQAVERHKQKWGKTLVTDLYTCAIDSLCCLAKSSLVPGQAWTYLPTYEYLGRAMAFIEIPLLQDAQNLDYFTKWVKCVSGALMNAAIALYRIDHYSHAIRFLVSCCTLTGTLWDFLGAIDKPSTSESNLGLIKEADTYFKAALTKRWELLGDCYSKTGDRKSAHQAFVQALKFSSLDNLNDASRSLQPGEIFTQPEFKRTGGLIERITHIAAFDLILREHTSLYGSFVSEVSTEALGLILEHQVSSLEKGISKPEIKLAIDELMKDALKLYDSRYPIRRSRILVWQLDLAYRVGDMGFSTNNVIPEIFSLLRTADLPDRDKDLTHFRRQYETMGYMWEGFLLHQRSELHDKVTPMIIQQATSAGHILEELFLCRATRPTPKTHRLNKQLSPSVAPMKIPRIATRSSPRKKPTVVKAPPVTPKPRRKILDTPPKAIEGLPEVRTDSLAFAIDPRLVSMIDMFSRLMGLLGHAPFKIRFLAVLQQMATLSLQPATNEYLYASTEAAIEYAKLGKSKHALAIFVHTLKVMNNAKPGVVLDTTRILVLLSYAEVLAHHANIAKSVQLYEEARLLFQSIKHSPSHSSSSEKVKNRAQIIELSARAAKVYALINVTRGNPHISLAALRQSLKLWNRAYETLLRVSPDNGIMNSKDTISNPFDMGSLAAALPCLGDVAEVEKETYRRNSLTEYIHWRIAEGLFCALLDLADAYFLQGSIRGSEYLVEQARSLATAINSTNYVGRAVTRMVEIQLHKRMLKDAISSINSANELIGDTDNINAANVARLSAQYQQLLDDDSQATSLYTQAMALVSDFSKILSSWERPLSSPRRSSIGASHNDSETDIFVPDFQAAILAQQLWLQRNESRSVINELMRKLDALPSSIQVELERGVISAKLALHEAYAKFRTDIFLSSLPESTIAIPMGLVSRDGKNPSIGTKFLMEILSVAQTYFQETLQRVRNSGKVTYAREASLSLTTLRLFQASLGHPDNSDADVAINMLDASTALTLRRELVEAIDQKFPMNLRDDLIWSSLSEHDQYQFAATLIEDGGDRDTALKMYWSALRSRYIYDHELENAKVNPIDVLPDNWTVVNISVTDDKNTILISRQCPKTQSLIFCVPIDRQGRKESGNEPFTFEDGSLKLKDILDESDQIAKTAKDVASDDRNSKVAWWAKRTALDKQLRELLENIEFCWLGGFKTVLHEQRQISINELNTIGDRMEKVFQRALVAEKKRIAQLKLNPSLVECFSTLPPQCRQEELEDIIYFILDLYQFHGIHIPLSEIDIDQLAVQLRTILEECAARKPLPIEDAHLFLILDKNVQGIPWESIPFLRGRSISRIPSLSFLLDRIEFARVQRQLKNLPASGKTMGKAVVDPKNVSFILNPSGDLEKSQARFEPWLKEMSDRSIGWKGIIGRSPSELEFTDALKQKDLVIYIGHGGAEQYVRSNKIKHLPSCAATMLWGCSSGFMHDMGDFDRHGTPYNYMIAGCPTLIACLWDVTDNELDRFSQSVFDKLRLNSENIKSWKDDGSVSVVTAVAGSRDACKLKYLTGAAPVIYGIPFYL